MTADKTFRIHFKARDIFINFAIVCPIPNPMTPEKSTSKSHDQGNMSLINMKNRIQNANVINTAHQYRLFSENDFIILFIAVRRNFLRCSLIS